MTDERVTVYSPRRFSVPGVIVETGLDTVRISYHPPRGKTCADWFYALDAGGKRAGQRMGDQDDPPVRYSVAPAIPDEAATDTLVVHALCNDEHEPDSCGFPDCEAEYIRQAMAAITALEIAGLLKDAEEP